MDCIMVYYILDYIKYQKIYYLYSLYVEFNIYYLTF